MNNTMRSMDIRRAILRCDVRILESAEIDFKLKLKELPYIVKCKPALNNKKPT
jgi:hypothetical protein